MEYVFLYKEECMIRAKSTKSNYHLPGLPALPTQKEKWSEIISVKFTANCNGPKYFQLEKQVYKKKNIVWL